MEKYLRLLNPKTTNFDSIGGGSHGAMTAQDVCVALSYAKLTQLQENLIRVKCLGANTIENVDLLSSRLVAKYIACLESRNTPVEYHESVVRAALIEFCLVPASYKPSVRNRALFVGVHFLVVHRYLDRVITDIFEELEGEFFIAVDKISFQLSKSK